MNDMSDRTKRLTAIIAFLQSAERLKDTLRSGRTAQGHPKAPRNIAGDCA